MKEMWLKNFATKMSQILYFTKTYKIMKRMISLIPEKHINWVLKLI